MILTIPHRYRHRVAGAIALILTIILATPAHAFRMFGPNGYMEPSKEDVERRQRQAQAEADLEAQRRAAEQAWIEEKIRIDEHNRRMQHYAQPDDDGTDCTQGEPEQRKARPGAHRRHKYRERTGFNTPMQRRQFLREVKAAQKAADRRAHPEKYRKEDWIKKVTGKPPAKK